MNILITSILFLVLPITTHSQIPVKPTMTLVSYRAFYASYFIRDEKIPTKDGGGSFAPFKEILDSKKQCIFNFYKKSILINSLNISINLFIEKADDYANGKVFQVKNSFGKQYLVIIEFSENNDISCKFFERDMINDFNQLTMYLCKRLN